MLLTDSIPSVFTYDPCSEDERSSSCHSDTDNTEDDLDDGRSEDDRGSRHSSSSDYRCDVTWFRDHVERIVFRLSKDYTFESQVHGSEEVMVYRARTTSSGEPVCIKVRECSSRNQGVPVEVILLKHIATQQDIRNDGMQQLQAYYQHDGMCAMVTPFYQSSPHWFEELSEKGPVAIRDFIKQLLDIISRLHDMGIMWRDCKPSNMVMVPPAQVEGDKFVGGKLVAIDFDLGYYSQCPKECTRSSVLGTDGFMSTLVLDKHARYGFDQDYYTAGVCLGMLMYNVSENHVNIDSVKQWKKDIDDDKHVGDPQLRNLFKDLTNTEPDGVSRLRSDFACSLS